MSRRLEPDTISGADTGSQSWLVDISANLFCVTLILLMISLFLGDHAAPVEPVETRRTHAVIAGTMSGAADAVAMLRRRTLSGSPVSSVDLHGDRLVLRRAGEADGSTIPTSETEAAIGVVSASSTAGPVDLFVFDWTHYGALMQGLERRGVPVQQMSVPQALRARAANAAGDTWSRSFTDLFGRAISEAQFPARLTAILQGGGDGKGASGAEVEPEEKSAPLAIGETTLPRNYVAALHVFWRFLLFLGGLWLLWKINSARWGKSEKHA